VLLDEPTTALDIGYQQEVLELIDRLRREGKIGVLSTMHDLTVAGLYPDSLVLLADGRINARGEARAVLTSEHLARAYGAAVRIIDDPRGPVVVPVRGFGESHPE
jgi:iron complex transport system ATP-binding protein